MFSAIFIQFGDVTRAVSVVRRSREMRNRATDITVIMKGEVLGVNNNNKDNVFQ